MSIRSCMICDHPDCENVYDTGERTHHRDLTAQAHSEGWSSTFANGGWTNTCTDHEEAA